MSQQQPTNQRTTRSSRRNNAASSAESEQHAAESSRNRSAPPPQLSRGSFNISFGSAAAQHGVNADLIVPTSDPEESRMETSFRRENASILDISMIAASDSAPEDCINDGSPDASHFNFDDLSPRSFEGSSLNSEINEYLDSLDETQNEGSSLETTAEEFLDWKELKAHDESPHFLNSPPIQIGVTAADIIAIDSVTVIASIDHIRVESDWSQSVFQPLSLIVPDVGQFMPFVFQPSKFHFVFF